MSFSAFFRSYISNSNFSRFCRSFSALAENNAGKWAGGIWALGGLGSLMTTNLPLFFVVVAIGGFFAWWWTLRELRGTSTKSLTPYLWTYLIIAPFITWRLCWTFSTSPANKSVTLHELNTSNVWEGMQGETINLTLTHKLIARLQPKSNQHNQAWYKLHPAIQHKKNGEQLRIVLILSIPNSCHLDVAESVWMTGRWRKESVGNITNFTTVIDSIPYGLPQKTDWEVDFRRIEPGDCEVTYITEGTDSKNRLVRRRETAVTLGLK